jgi:hypothetical protein
MGIYGVMGMRGLRKCSVAGESFAVIVIAVGDVDKPIRFSWLDF